MMGVSYGDSILSPLYMQNPPLGANPDFPEADNFNRLDVDSAISLESRIADPVSRRATIEAVAATSAALEGSAAGQMEDLHPPTPPPRPPPHPTIP